MSAKAIQLRQSLPHGEASARLERVLLQPILGVWNGEAVRMVQGGFGDFQ